MGEGDAKNPLKSLEKKIAAAKKAVELRDERDKRMMKI